MLIIPYIYFCAEKPVERKRTSSSKKPKGGVSIFGSGENSFIFLVKINSII